MTNAKTIIRRCCAAIATLLLLAGCSHMAQLDGAVPGTRLALRDRGEDSLPRSEDLDSKATGQYEFVATAPSGKKLYGILPLRVNGGHMALSILFFAPALAIGGFRDAYSFYEFDVEKAQVRYKSNEGDGWRFYQPTPAESERAKAFFDAQK